MQFQQDSPKDENIAALKFLPENLEKFRSTERSPCASGAIDNLSLAQLHKPYFVGKFSIPEA